MKLPWSSLLDSDTQRQSFTQSARAADGPSTRDDAVDSANGGAGDGGQRDALRKSAPGRVVVARVRRRRRNRGIDGASGDIASEVDGVDVGERVGW